MKWLRGEVRAQGPIFCLKERSMRASTSLNKVEMPGHRTRLSTNLTLAVAATLLPLVVLELSMRLYHAYVKARTPSWC